MEQYYKAILKLMIVISIAIFLAICYVHKDIATRNEYVPGSVIVNDPAYVTLFSGNSVNVYCSRNDKDYCGITLRNDCILYDSLKAIIHQHNPSRYQRYFKIPLNKKHWFNWPNDRHTQDKVRHLQYGYIKKHNELQKTTSIPITDYIRQLKTSLGYTAKLF